MTYLVDSDVVADYLNGRVEAVDLLGQLAPDGLAISIVTFAEVYEGIYHGRDVGRFEATFQRFLTGVNVLGINKTIARRFARIRGALRAQGQPIAPSDVFIAATALHYDLILVTRNRRHYERISDLKLYQR